MEYLKISQAIEKDSAGRHLIYTALLPGIVLGSIGWGSYFAKKIENADAGKYFRKNMCYASENPGKN